MNRIARLVVAALLLAFFIFVSLRAAKASDAAHEALADELIGSTQEDMVAKLRKVRKKKTPERQQIYAAILRRARERIAAAGERDEATAMAFVLACGAPGCEPAPSSIPDSAWEPEELQKAQKAAGGAAPTRPRKIHGPQPHYPPLAMESRIEGPVFVMAVIATDGSVRGTAVTKGLPLGLSEAALRAVRVWRFEPATLNGQPIAVPMALRVNFELE